MDISMDLSMDIHIHGNPGIKRCRSVPKIMEIGSGYYEPSNAVAYFFGPP